MSPSPVKATKRSPSRDAHGQLKKIKQQSELVCNALKQASLPSEAKSMLVHGAAHCLSTFADQRHQYQKSVVQMAGESLSAVESTLVAEVAAAKEKVDSMDQNKMEMAVPEQAHRIAALKGTEAVKWAESIEARMEHQQASDALKPVLKQQKAGDADYNIIATKIEHFTELKSGIEKIKEEVPSKKALTKVVNDLKDLNVEETLLDSLRGVLSKPSSERGDFDALTLGQLNDNLAVKSKEMEARLAELEPGKNERQAATTAAQSKETAAKEKYDTAKAALKAAEKDVKDGEAALKKAEDDLQGFAKALKAAQDMLKDAEKTLADFRKGPLDTFKYLESCNAPVPEPEAAAEGAPSAGDV